jgi:hypothetical protein
MKLRYIGRRHTAQAIELINLIYNLGPLRTDYCALEVVVTNRRLKGED